MGRECLVLDDGRERWRSESRALFTTGLAGQQRQGTHTRIDPSHGDAGQSRRDQCVKTRWL